MIFRSGGTLNVLFLVMMSGLGLIFGSFANVVIWRFPRGESLSFPPSHCPSCGTPIEWYRNIPVVSWMVLRGKCASCGSPISVRYPIVEALTGALWLSAAIAFGPSLRCGFAAVFFYLLIILAFIDLDTMRLPNPIVGLLAVLGFVGVLAGQFSSLPAAPLIDLSGPLSTPLVSAVVGTFVASGLSLGIALAYSYVRKAQGFGMGDVKLLAAMGPFLGPYTLLVLFAGSLVGALVGVVMARTRGTSLGAKIPFGPFLAAGAVAVTYFGQPVWAWYLGLVAG